LKNATGLETITESTGGCGCGGGGCNPDKCDC
jgi:hypothetical protein